MKKGFTLIELLAVVAILGILAILIVPRVIDIYNESSEETMTIQENQVLDAVKLFVEDFCRNPMSQNHKSACANYRHDTSDGESYFCVNDFQKTISETGTKPYFNDVTYQGGAICKGIVVFDRDGKSYKNGKTYLICGDNEEYVSTGVDSTIRGYIGVCYE